MMIFEALGILELLIGQKTPNERPSLISMSAVGLSVFPQVTQEMRTPALVSSNPSISSWFSRIMDSWPFWIHGQDQSCAFSKGGCLNRKAAVCLECCSLWGRGTVGIGAEGEQRSFQGFRASGRWKLSLAALLVRAFRGQQLVFIGRCPGDLPGSSRCCYFILHASLHLGTITKIRIFYSLGWKHFNLEKYVFGNLESKKNTQK